MENEKMSFNIKAALEAMLFVSEDALKESKLVKILACEEVVIADAFKLLQREYEDRESGIVLKKTAAGWKFYTHPMYHEQISDLVLSWDTRKLSQAALETLAIVAYNQPVTRNSISSVRGVNSDGSVASLAEKGLIAEAGKLENGAILYKTTLKFLQEFGLSSIKELPPLSEFAVEQSTIDALRARLGFSEEYMNALENAEFFEDENTQFESKDTNSLKANKSVSSSDGDVIANKDSRIDVSDVKNNVKDAYNEIDFNDDNYDDDEDDDMDDIIKQSITAKADDGIDFID